MKLPIGTYTFYNNMENCPHKAWHLYVLKDIPRTESPEMKWGNDVHTAMENAIAKGTPLPDTMKDAVEVASAFRQIYDKLPTLVEAKLAMTARGEPCDFWDDKLAWFRGKADVSVFTNERATAWIVDWKTGSVREDPFELETNALLLKVNHPTLTEVIGEYYWIKTGSKGLRYTLTKFGDTFARLQALRAEAEGYMRSGEWPKRKNPLCGWCGVLSCEHNTSHKRK